jgi:ribosomal protein S18 acetylase RimI-like enzyme
MASPTSASKVSIRPFHADDEGAVVGVWHRSGQAAYTYLPTWQAFTLDEAATVFRDVIRAHCRLWVGTLDEHVVAYLALKGDYLDRLYVDPGQWHQGWGARLVVFAKHLSPSGLRLHTHQENRAARRLYETHGFTAVRFGVSPPPESAPDVEYRWTPPRDGS